MNENNNAEILFTRAILQASRNYKKLPKFLNDEIEMYLDTTGQNIKEAIENLKIKY